LLFEEASKRLCLVIELLPKYVGAHEEQDKWSNLRQLVESSPENEFSGLIFQRAMEQSIYRG